MAQLGFRDARRYGRPGRPAEVNDAVDRLEGQGAGSRPILYRPGGRPHRDTPAPSASSTIWTGPTTTRSCRWWPAPSRHQEPVSLTMPIRNVHRTVGTMISGEIASRYGGQGLPEDTIELTFTRLGRAELRRVLPPGVTFGSKATPTTTWARGCPAAGSSSSRAGLRLRPAGQRHRRQRAALRRHLRRGLHQRPGRRAVRRPQQRRRRPWSRASATMAAST